MFKRCRRLLIRFGVSGQLAICEHLLENLFLIALMIGRSIVWPDWAYLIYHGPILCFLYVAITELVYLISSKENLKNNNTQTDITQDITKPKHMERTLWDRFDHINENFFDITATIIIYVSILIFLDQYTFGDTRKNHSSGCSLGERYDDDYNYGYYYSDNIDDPETQGFFWYNGTYSAHPNLIDDTIEADDEYNVATAAAKESSLTEAKEIVEWFFMSFLFAEICASIGELNPATILPLLYYGLSLKLCTQSTRNDTQFYFSLCLIPIILLLYIGSKTFYIF